MRNWIEIALYEIPKTTMREILEFIEKEGLFSFNLITTNDPNKSYETYASFKKDLKVLEEVDSPGILMYGRVFDRPIKIFVGRNLKTQDSMAVFSVEDDDLGARDWNDLTEEEERRLKDMLDRFIENFKPKDKYIMNPERPWRIKKEDEI